MKIHMKQNVFDAALDRIRWLFDEFDNVVVSVSGGKDSTVVFNLAMIVAEEKGRLPLPVMWLDQEAEWQATVDTVREIMYDPRVEPRWYQIPMRLFNSTSTTDHWLNCWDPENEDLWIHPADPIAIRENIYGTDRFARLFRRIAAVEYEDERVCYLAGVRTEESPARYTGLTGGPTYKWATWGTGLDRTGHITMYPIYDWSYTDVWKAIHDNNWSYNKIYDEMYRYGIQVRNMRVSNVHHETAVHSLWFLQEIEGETWSRLTQRIAGIDALSKFDKNDYFPTKLPFMFSSWREYRDWLLPRMITDEDSVARFQKKFDEQDEIWGDLIEDTLMQTHVRSIVQNDHEFVLLQNFEMAPDKYAIRMAKARQKEAA